LAFAQVAQGSSKTKTRLRGLRKGFLKLKQACPRWAKGFLKLKQVCPARQGRIGGQKLCGFEKIS